MSLVSQVSRVGKKFTIYLPKAIVEALNISEGDKVIITVHRDSIVIKPIKKFLRKKKTWTEASFREVERDSEELTRIAEED